MKIIKMLLSFIKLSFKEYHTYFVVLIFNTLVLSAQTIFAAYTLSLIISLIETNNFSSSLNYAILIVFVEVLLLFLKLLCQKLLSKHQAIMEVKIDQLLARKIMELPFSYLEDPKYLELEKSASFSINNMGAIIGIFNSISTLFSNIITLFGLLIIILSFADR